MSTRNLKSPTLLAQDIHSVYGGTREFATSVRSRQGLLSTLRSAVRSPHASITSFRSGDVVLSNNHLLATSTSAGDELIEKLSGARALDLLDPDSIRALRAMLTKALSTG